MTNTTICPVCGGTEMKIGKHHDSGNVHSLGSKELGGAHVHITFCANCGEVVGMRVLEPDRIEPQLKIRRPRIPLPKTFGQ